jgi:ApbE superfamily uncharacterized protein (UPF0280 family)
MQGPVAAYLEGGRRLHLQHGPIDLILGAETGAGAVAPRAFEAAEARFRDTLERLVAELPVLRSRLTPQTAVRGPVARRMVAAASPFAAAHDLSPMICVAGAVADDILAAMRAAAPLARAYVNNGGDIALHLAPGARFDIAIAAPLGARLGTVRIGAEDRIGGIATSGAGGRSFSLGIAESVTVLAASAAQADVSATLIANAVDLPGDPRIGRARACDLQPDSDLRDRRGVTHVPPLSTAESEAALARGRARAESFLAAGRIAGAALFLQGRSAVVGRAVTDQLAIPEAMDV